MTTAFLCVEYKYTANAQRNIDIFETLQYIFDFFKIFSLTERNAMHNLKASEQSVKSFPSVL